jgi:Protein of unknown function DUF262
VCGLRTRQRVALTASRTEFMPSVIMPRRCHRIARIPYQLAALDAAATIPPVRKRLPMKDAQKLDRVSLNTLVNYLRDGRFVIPDFQREFEWKPWDIRELMRSIFLDYYIGSLLL